MKRALFTPILSLALIVALTTAAFADGMVVPAEPVVPQIRDAFTVEYHVVTVDVDGQHATTHVDQKIKNVSGGLAQAIYMFPVPRGANIAQFSMFIGEQEMQGEMMEAEKAKGIYQDYVRKLIDPALLEYVGQGVYRTSVFPFQKDESKRIRLQYKELLTKENGLVHYLYPLNTEKFSKYPLDRCRVEVNLTLDAPLKNIYSPSHNIQITRIDDTRVQVVFEVAGERPTTDFELFYSTEEGATGANLLSYKAAGEDHGYFVYLISPGQAQGEIADKDIVFVVDTSGSMLEDRKLVQVKEALTYCLNNLNEGDRFNVVAFSDYINPFKNQICENTEANRADALAFVTRLRGEGGTNINGAFARAFASFDEAENRKRMVIFLTDGRPTIGERDEKEIAKNVREANAKFEARVFNFGVGDDVNAVLLDWFAEQNHGLTEYIRSGESIDARVINFYNKIRNPVMSDCQFSVEGVRVEDTLPATLPDLFAGTQMVIVGKYVGDGEAKITFRGTIAGEEYSRTDVVTFNAPLTTPTANSRLWVEHLWAGRKIGHLLNEIRLHGKSQEVIDAIVRLSKRYGIPTPYTSFLVLEDDVVPSTADATRRAREEMNSANAPGWGGNAVEDALQAQGLSRGDRPAGAESGGGGMRLLKDEHGNEVRTADRVIVVGTRTFYRRGNQWVDQAITGNVTPAETVKLLSERFFELAEQFPELNQIAARGPATVKLGEQVIQFVNP